MKKIIYISLIIIIISGIFTNTCNATFSINKADLYTKGCYTDLLYLGDTKIECDYVVYKKDGKEYPAYCLQRDLQGVKDNDEYSVNVDKLVTNVMVWRVITNGYPYKSLSELGCKTKEEAFLATKQAVYCVLYDREPESYTAIGEAGTRCLNAMKKIVSSAKKSTEIKVSAELSIKDESLTWKIDEKNSENIYKIFSVSAKSTINSYEVAIQGDLPEGTKIVDINDKEKNAFKSDEKFKIIIPIKNLSQSGTFNINATGEVDTKPILYGASGISSRQDYALTGSIYEEGEGIRKVNYEKNNTKITIIKEESETSKKIQGAEFEVLDEKQRVIHSGIVTNSNGEAVIENLLPGVYYVKEIKTLPGYVLYDKLIKVELELNESSKVTVKNSQEEIEIEENTLESEIVVEKTASEIEVTSEPEKEIQIKQENNETKVKLPKTGM